MTERASEIIDEFKIPIPLDGEVIQLRRDDSGNTAQISASHEPKGPRPKSPNRHPFEVYVWGYASGAATTANVHVATGTILQSESDIEDIVSISGMDDTFAVTAGDWIYLDVAFNEDGDVTSCTLTKGSTWSGYPALFEVSGSGNSWRHPIAHIRSPLTGKAEEIGGEGAVPNSGEFPELAAHHIAQKTHTHLVVVQDCIDGEMIWKLQPGQGGKD